MFMFCLDARLLPQSYLYPNLLQDADRVSGQLRGDKECPFSGVTSSGRVWRKVPESDVRNVHWPKTVQRPLILPSDTESTRLSDHNYIKQIVVLMVTLMRRQFH